MASKTSKFDCSEDRHSWEANSSLPSQEICRFLYNLKVTTWSQVSTARSLSWVRLWISRLTTIYFKIRFNIIFLSNLRYSSRFPAGFPTLLSDITCHVPRPTHLPLFYHPSNIWWRLRIRKLVVIHFSPIYSFLLFSEWYDLCFLFRFR